MYSGLISSELILELLAQQVASFTNNQTTIIRAIGKKIDKPLKASEAWLLRVLILVSPRLVRRNIGAIWEGEVGGIE
jgi:hypothetical protein